MCGSVVSLRETGVRPACVQLYVCVQELLGRGSVHVSVRQYLDVCVLCDCVWLMGCFSFTWWLY